MKVRYYYNIKHIECECGVWRIDEYDLPCWNETDRDMLTSEAMLRLIQSIRNLGYALLSNIWRKS